MKHPIPLYLFDSLFSLSRNLTGKMTSDIIDKLEIVIEKKQCCVEET